MLNRSQIYTLLMLRKRGDNIFAGLPRDIVGYIGGIEDTRDVEIIELLHHVAYGNLIAAKAMLDKNPRLVLQSAHTETPSGLKVLHTTPLECALGAGDPDMAKMIELYFDAFDGGAKVRDEQLSRYRQYIEDMLNPVKNPPYDFTLLFEALIAATPEDVTAALNLDFTHESVLRDVLAQFRKDFTLGAITRGMHFNYLHLMRASEVYSQKSDDLYKSGRGECDKKLLFRRQVIGFIQRGLPAIDRMVFAHGLYDVAVNKAKIVRSFKFKIGNDDFPVTACDISCSGLGYEYFVYDAGWSGARATSTSTGLYGSAFFGNLCREKNSRLAELMRPRREEKTSRCVIC